MSEQMQLIEVRIEQLLPHPDQHKVYEKRDNSELMASISAKGLRFPIEVADSVVFSTDPEYDGFYIVYSGHRRLEVLKELGYRTVMVNLRQVDDRLEVDELFVLANNYREGKTESEKISEILYDKQIMCQVAEVARLYGNTKDDTAKKLEQGRILRRSKITPGEIFSVSDYIQEKYDVSEHRYKQLTRIFDDNYLDDRLGKLNSLRGKIDAEFDNDIREVYAEIRAKVIAFELNYRKADLQLSDLLKSAEKRLESKTAKSEKVKKGKDNTRSGKPAKVKVKTIKFSLPKNSTMPDVNRRIANEHHLPCAFWIDDETGVLYLDAGRGAVAIENSVLHEIYNKTVA